MLKRPRMQEERHGLEIEVLVDEERLRGDGKMYIKSASNWKSQL